MYVDISRVRRGDKVYTRYLLRECFREGGKIKHRTIANLGPCKPEEIEAIKLALKHKGNLEALGEKPALPPITMAQGPSFGAIHTILELARSLGLVEALGSSRDGTLALWQVIARVINQGSRLSAVRLAKNHATQELLGLTKFDEDDLYANLDWLTEQQATIEQRLCQQQNLTAKGLYLYDVTSSYFEGDQNELSAFGYNRDKKKGKKQIVIGLLCNDEGRPLSIEVFPGNTNDTKTFGSQVRKVAERFGGGEVTLVGDRGMIKGPQIKDLTEMEGFHYITAITRPQIETLLVKGVLQLDLFETNLTEVIDNTENLRYVLRRNPVRAKEIAASRQAKYGTLEKAVAKANTYLADHPKADAGAQLETIRQRATKLDVDAWVSLECKGRTLTMTQKTDVLSELAQLDGCYAIKTDLTVQQASKETVHARYKDLSKVEWAFRSSKTVNLEMRPVHVRLESRTRGHAFVVMLAYSIIHALQDRWKEMDITVREGINQLTTLCLMEIRIPGQPCTYQLPTPNPCVQKLLQAAGVALPARVSPQSSTVTTKKKLTSRRK